MNIGIKQFIKKICAFLACFLISLVALNLAFLMFIAPQYSQGYDASILDKMDRLEKLHSAGEPKIILVGDSNLPYGINSEEIEESLNMPVVDLGIHGGLGIKFQDSMIKGYVDAGDVVVVCYSGYGGTGDVGVNTLVWITIENYFELWHLIPESSLVNEIKAYPKYVVKALRLFITGSGNQKGNDSYSRSSFNKYGDLSYYREYEGGAHLGAMHTGYPGISDEVADELNQWNRYCQAHGAKMVMAAYPIMVDQETPEDNFYEEYETILAEKLDFPYISHFKDYKFDAHYFYNTAMHMTSAGAELRTQQLIQDLKGYLDEYEP